MENRHALLILAALLHDVGKFAQRVGNEPYSDSLESEYCPVRNSYYSHQHVLYTDWFIENRLPLPPELESSRSCLARMAAAHHKPDVSSREEKCLEQADWLSSGNDRELGDSEGDLKTSRMESVFSSVRLKERENESEEHIKRYTLQALDADDDPIFPVDLGTARKTSYADLYKAFLEALESLPRDMGIAHYTASLQTVLERFTWCIPSSTYGTRADISLFDHSYTTAAIAQALYCSEQPVQSLQKAPLLLLSGELSGMQKFIFGIGEQGDRGASKLLRARSFMLQMLSRSIWMELLRRCDLSPAACIADAGGHFILLLPDTAAVREKVDSVIREAAEHVLKAFNGVLRISFAQQKLMARELKREAFPAVFRKLKSRERREKLRPFAQLLTETDFSPVLDIRSEEYAAHGVCPFCGLRPARGEEGDEAGCGICSELIRNIGRKLPEARYAVISDQGEGFPLFGSLKLRLEKDEPRASEASALGIFAFRDRIRFSAVPIAGYVPRISEEDLQRWQDEGVSLTEDGESPRAGNPKTFGMLALESRIRTERGFRSVPCIAACKADVDNLGLIFGIGLEEHFSISRFAMLSRMMHHFLSSCLIRIIEKSFPNIYVVFAGGDDLFVLGPWSEVVRFAEMLHAAFGRFTGGNPDVTLSAGVALAKPGLPMRSIRKLAENQLEQSKSYTQDGKAVKNAVTLFDVASSWKEFEEQMTWGRKLEELCVQGEISQGFVRRLLGYARQACRFHSKGYLADGMYRSHMIYDISRNIDAGHREEMLKLCYHKQFFQMESGITWALYRTRTTV